MTADLRFRNPALVVAICSYVYDSDEPVAWNELLAVFSDETRPWKTVENTLYDLQQFGVIQRVGRAGGRSRADTRAVKSTTLGRAWLDRELLELPTDGPDDDPLDEAERIAAELEIPDELLAVHDLTPGSETEAFPD